MLSYEMKLNVKDVKNENFESSNIFLCEDMKKDTKSHDENMWYTISFS